MDNTTNLYWVDLVGKRTSGRKGVVAYGFMSPQLYDGLVKVGGHLRLMGATTAKLAASGAGRIIPTRTQITKYTQLRLIEKH